MSDDLIPCMPSPKIREQFRSAAKSLCNRQVDSHLSDSGNISGTTKSSAQVAPFVLPQQKASELKLSGITNGSTAKTKRSESKRSTPLAVRLTDAQKATIKERAEEAGCNVNEYIRNLVLGSSYRSPLPPNVYRQLLECKLELTRQGHNLNQIAKQLNAGTIVDEEALQLLNDLAPSMIETHAAIRRVLTGDQVES